MILRMSLAVSYMNEMRVCFSPEMSVCLLKCILSLLFIVWAVQPKRKKRNHVIGRCLNPRSTMLKSSNLTQAFLNNLLRKDGTEESCH